jgi:hypothetical protein
MVKKPFTDILRALRHLASSSAGSTGSSSERGNVPQWIPRDCLERRSLWIWTASAGSQWTSLRSHLSHAVYHQATAIRSGCISRVTVYCDIERQRTQNQMIRKIASFKSQSLRLFSPGFVSTNCNSRHVEGSKVISNSFENVAVSRVARKEKPLPWPHYSERAPHSSVSIEERAAGPMLRRSEDDFNSPS